MLDAPIAHITIGPRHRKEMGDLKKLAASIKRHGLLQPIGVTENDELVFGERRLRACRDLLGMSHIAVRVVHVERIVDGEFDENEVREDFTASERVGILKAVSALTEERRGRPEINCAQLPTITGMKSREINAQKAGFDSHRSAERAAQVVEHGTPALVAAMDAGDASLHAAALVATLPRDEQVAVVAAGPAAIRAKATDIRTGKHMKPDTPLTLVTGSTSVRPPSKDARRIAANIVQQLSVIADIAAEIEHLPPPDPDIGNKWAQSIDRSLSVIRRFRKTLTMEHSNDKARSA